MEEMGAGLQGAVNQRFLDREYQRQVQAGIIQLPPAEHHNMAAEQFNDSD